MWTMESRSHMTNIEQFSSHLLNMAHFLSHTTNTATIIYFVFIEMPPSAAFANASGLVGDMKRLYLSYFDGYLSVSDDLLPFT